MLILFFIIVIAIGIFRSSGDGHIYRGAGLTGLGDAHDRQHAGAAFVLIILAVLFIAAGIMSMME